jgi:hypothetical protein
VQKVILEVDVIPRQELDFADAKSGIGEDGEDRAIAFGCSAQNLLDFARTPIRA